MNKADKRAIKITELNEELELAKEIIEKFVWPPDDTAEGRQDFLQKAAMFAGCTIPHFVAGGESDTPEHMIVTAGNKQKKPSNERRQMEGVA